MDDDAKAALGTMMSRINDNHEQVLQRFRGIDERLNTIDHTLVAINTTMSTMTTMLTLIGQGFGDHARRITDLEGKRS